MVVSRKVGARVRRKEDPRLIQGSSLYVDDVRLSGVLNIAFVRSLYSHANIKRIDVSEALKVPGVVAVFTAQDLEDTLNKTKRIGGEGETPTIERPEYEVPAQFPLAIERVRHVGEAVAAVVGNSEYSARDGADAVIVDYEPLPAVTDPRRAMEDGAPQLWDELTNNVATRWDRTVGDFDSTYQDAPVKVKQQIRSQRLAGVPMEPRGVLATLDPITSGLTVWTSTQTPHRNRDDIAEALEMGQELIHTITPQVGGGFGVKIGSYPEDLLVSAIALKVRRPVKWIETRAENFLATHQGRDQFAEVEVAADTSGKILAYRLNVIQDQGAYPKDTDNPELTGRMAVGCYDIPVVDIHSIGVCTNTMDVGAYRGAGRPEAAYYIERAIDLVAAEAGLDPAEVRRINFIAPEKFPYVTSTGERYDTGEYEKALNKALDVSNYQDLRRQQQEELQQGRYLGIGLASYVEICGFGPFESATLRVEPGGNVSVFSGIMPQGQGQETTFAQLVADHLGVDFDRIAVHFGNTSSTSQGKGTSGSRGLALGGSALMKSIASVREKASRIAAHLLEVSAADIELNDGKYQVTGAPDRRVTMEEIARLAYQDASDLPEDIDAGLESTDFFRPGDETFPFGTHVALVELFPETGKVEILRYVSIDDCGFIVSPMLVEGQVHGGLAQGIGQALFEEVRYDEGGQLLTATLMDYAIPKASFFPLMFETGHTETKTPINPLGAKGIGEAATIGSTPAIANAVVDALKPFGITHLDIPFRPQTIWEAINQRGNGTVRNV